MCNLYLVTSAPEAMIQITRAMITSPSIGNMAPMDVYPDYAAPIIRNTPEGRELTRARWGMPKPPAALEGKRVDSGVTNVRNTSSPHWRRWLGVESRCVVPFSAFSEPMRVEGKSVPGWFTLASGHELAFFAGIWTRWTSVRKVKEGEVTADLCAFLTCEANRGGDDPPGGHAGDPDDDGGGRDVAEGAVGRGEGIAAAAAGSGAGGAGELNAAPPADR